MAECKVSCASCIHYKVCKVWVKHSNSLARVLNAYQIEFPMSANYLCDRYTPTADVVEVRHGRWLFHDTDENDMTIVKCSECGRKRYFGANYCPNCGAKMDGKGEGE